MSASWLICRRRTAKRCWSCAQERKKKAGLPAGQRGREMLLGLQQGLKEEGVEVSLVRLCEWFGIARRTVYCQATK